MYLHGCVYLCYKTFAGLFIDTCIVGFNHNHSLCITTGLVYVPIPIKESVVVVGLDGGTTLRVQVMSYRAAS